MTVSIVIVSYNVKEFLDKCISSIISSKESVEIIVVDNNSNDGSLDMLRIKYPQVRIIANKNNVGFSAANNQGIAISSGDAIFLLNPDTEIVGDALTKLLAFLEQQKECCVVGPRLLNSDKSLQISAWKYPSVAYLVLELFYLHRIFGTLNYPVDIMAKCYEPDALSGAALIFKKELLRKVEGLDPLFFWMEDVDFCYRAHKSGYKIFYYPLAEIIHYSGKSSLKNQHIAISNQLISKLKFERKHKGILTYYFASIVILLHIISRYLLLVIPSLFNSTAKVKRYAYFFSLKKYFNFIGGDGNVITN
jgi:hypothetical protein